MATRKTVENINLDGANYWSRLKNLNNMITKSVTSQSPDLIHDLQNLLKDHKPDFKSLLVNAPLNSFHRDLVRSSSKDGITIAHFDSHTNLVIPEVVVNEALAFSDTFKIDELISLELIITGAEQEPRYPGMSRGHIAVLLYYAAKRSVLYSLKLLIESLNGRSWSTTTTSEAQKCIENFISQLKSEGVIFNCLEQLENFNISKELDTLMMNRLLGPSKYKKQVMDIIKEIEQLYAEILFSFASQTDFNPRETTKLIEVLSKSCQVDSNGCLEPVSTILLMALLYLLDVKPLQTCDEMDPLLRKLPVVVNKTLLVDIQRAVEKSQFNIESVKIVIDFARLITCKTLSILPVEDLVVDDEDDRSVERVIEAKVFEALTLLLAANPTVYGEKFYLNRLHDMVADFIVLFPLKIKELKDKGDETGRLIAAYAAENIQPPASLSRDFEKFVLLIAEIYSHDRYGLAAEIWAATDEDKLDLPKYVAFHKFIRSTIDSYLPQVLHVPILKMLTSFAVLSPFNVYMLLKSSGINESSQFSLDHFFNTLHHYFASFKGAERPQMSVQISQQRFTMANFAQINLSINDLEIVCSILQLIENIVRNDRNCCLSIAENQRYSCVPTLIGLLICPIPRKLKASILSTISGLAYQAASVALGIWIRLDAILPKPQVAVSNFVSYHQPVSWQSGLAVEVEDIEPKHEEYSISIAFLSTVSSLLPHIGLKKQSQHQSSLEACITFIINSILLKCDQRVYKLEEEKWTIKLKCLEILNEILSMFDANSDGTSLKAAFVVMSQILQENSLLQCVLEIVEDIVAIYEPSTTSTGVVSGHRNMDVLKSCLGAALRLLNTVSVKEKDFIDCVHNLPGYPTAMLLPLATLFTHVNRRTENIDRLATLVRVIGLTTVSLRVECVKLLHNLVESDGKISEKILLQMKTMSEQPEDYLIHGFVDCVESDEDELCCEALKFILTCVKCDSSPGMYGFSHRVLGFDRDKSDLKLPGSLGQAYNCLHTTIEMLSITNEEENVSKKRALAMEIIYMLCKNPETSDNLLRFLRTSYEFIVKYLDRLERKRLMLKDRWLTDKNMLEVAWFLRVLSIELKVTSDSNLKSNRNAYVKSLLGAKADRKLTGLVPDVVMTHICPAMDKWQFFEPKELKETLVEVRCGDSSLIDVKKLHQKLLVEVSSLGAQIGHVQTGLIQKEIQNILQYALSLNRSQEQLAENVIYFESWRELVETLITVGCLETFNTVNRTRILIQLVQELLQKASMVDTITAHITPISSVILLASASLCCMKPESSVKTQLLMTAKGIMSLLESSSSSSLWSQYKRARVNLYGALLHIYRTLPHSLLFELRPSSRLLEKLCKDMLSGHEITKVLAMSVLNESETTWTRELANDGTLRSLIDLLLDDDRDVKDNKFDIHCKSFYSFDSKMALLMRIASDATGVRILNNVGLVDVLCALECVEIYPFLVCQSGICYKMFSSVLRLLLTMSNFNDLQGQETFLLFINTRASVLSDIIRMAPNIRTTAEGVTVLTLISAFVSRMLPSVNKQLERSFLHLLNNYVGSVEISESKIVANILFGYVKISLNNGLKPILAPSWSSKGSYVNVGSPTLGCLLMLIDENVEKCIESKNYLSIVESCLYLIWHHLNFYFQIHQVPTDQKLDVQKLKTEASGVANDLFFAKIQNFTAGNSFVEAMVRRIKRIIILK